MYLAILYHYSKLVEDDRVETAACNEEDDMSKYCHASVMTLSPARSRFC